MPRVETATGRAKGRRHSPVTTANSAASIAPHGRNRRSRRNASPRSPRRTAHPRTPRPRSSTRITRPTTNPRSPRLRPSSKSPRRNPKPLPSRRPPSRQPSPRRSNIPARTVPERIPEQVFYNSRTIYVPSTVFDRFPHAGTAQRRNSGNDTRQDNPLFGDNRHGLSRKSSALILAAALLLLLGVASVTVVRRAGGKSYSAASSQVHTMLSDKAITEEGNRQREFRKYRHALSKVPKLVDHNPYAEAPKPGSLSKIEKPVQAAVATFVRNTNRPRKPLSIYECTTDSCVKEGERLASLVDPLLNPCEDFYEYICANWAEEHPIPKGGEYVSYRTRLVEYIENRLDKAVRTVLNKILSTPMAFNVLSSEVKAVLLRNACMEVDRLNDRGLQPLKEVLELLHLPEWPAANVDINASQIENVAGALGYRLGLFPLVSVSLERDPAKPSKFIIALDDPSREVIRRNEFFSTEHELLRYENLVRKAFDKLENTALSDMLGSAALGLEDEISQALLPLVTPEEKLRHYMKLPVSDLPRCSKFRWLVFLNSTFQKVRPVHREEVVLVKNMPYLKKLAAILNGRQRRTIINYLGFKAMLMFSLLLPPSTEGDVAKLYGRILTGLSHELPRWRVCLRMAEDTMPFAFLVMYHDVFSKEHNVLQLRSILDSIKDLLGSSIEDIEWMSSRDAARALDRLRRLQFAFFLPNWISNEENRNVFYESVQDVPVGNLLRSFMNARSAHVAHHFQRLLYNPNQLGWLGSVFDVSPIYDAFNNTMYVPMGVFAEPMGFDSVETPLHIPRVLRDVARELLSVVTDYGSSFDNHNAIRDWWSAATRTTYKNHSDCLAEQYNLTIGADHSGRGYSRLVAEANVKDNAVMPFLLHMFQRVLKEGGVKGNFILGNLPNATTYQLFFDSYGLSFCENTNEAYIRKHLLTSGEALAKHRVNVPMWNSDEFGGAFHCLKGSVMNPTRKCKFWRFQ
ncbi:neprilysin-1-like [Ornithodoros turicata]|uniref:neprilysin-1-like n=1 Tax=Ornithodoros turicata TaxID=34597 RepID=UPI00313A4927